MIESRDSIIKQKIYQELDYKLKLKQISNDCDIVKINDDAVGFAMAGIISDSKENLFLHITTDDKIAFQETMDEFVTEVSDLADFNTLNVYANNVEWSGKIVELDLEFFYTINEPHGIYINGQMVKVNEEYLELINKLQNYYEKFKSKWSKIVSSRQEM
jgi:hypothetical protein